METVRVFVGCSLDLGAARKLVELSRTLRRSFEGAGWKAVWVPPPNLHVTLKFVGEVDAGTVPALSDAVAGVVKRHAPMRLGLRELVTFPDADEPKVIAVGISDGHDALAALARALDDACFEVGFPRETRPYRGHVTLARVRHQAGALSALSLPRLDAGVATVNDVGLYRSDQARAGVEYLCLSRHTLGEPKAQRPAEKPGETDGGGRKMSPGGQG